MGSRWSRAARYQRRRCHGQDALVYGGGLHMHRQRAPYHTAISVCLALGRATMFLEPQRHNVLRLSGTPCTSFVMVLGGVSSIGLHRLRPASAGHLALVLILHLLWIGFASSCASVICGSSSVVVLKYHVPPELA